MPSTASIGAALAAMHGAHADAQVRALHPRVVAQLGRRALGDHLAPVDDRDAIGEAEQEAHVVLDDDDRERGASARRSARRAAPCLRRRARRSARRGTAGAAARPARRRSRARAGRRTTGSSPARCSLPARPTRASTAAASSCAASSRPRSRHIEKPRARTAGSAMQHVVERACRRRTGSSPGTSATAPCARCCRGGRPVMSSPAKRTRPRSGGSGR